MCYSTARHTFLWLITRLSESFYLFPVAIEHHSITIGATLGLFLCATFDVMLMTFPCSFFLDPHRITSKEYIPSNSDILRAPVVPQMGVAETCFLMGQLFIRLYDINAGRIGCGQRKKWIHLFENMTSIIFCTPLPDYDRWDENGQGRICFPFALMLLYSKLQWLLSHSLDLFDSVINSRWFLRTSIILFLTGIEEFKVKLFKVRYNLVHVPLLFVYLSRQVPLENYYPGYTGGADIYKAARYILWRFVEVNRAPLNVYPQ
jgi:guanine nucleotide-binding protein G(i) subunit alpha